MRNRRRWAALLCGWISITTVALAADWPQFRGPNRDNISTETGLLHKWPAGGPRVLWTTDVCQGYAAAAICAGRVYFEDYGRDEKEWYLRCLALADGKELWRFKESKTIRANHGITRAAPAVDGKYVFALDPKCVFHCLDAETGKELWRKDFVDDYKAQIPPWNNGQNPLIEADRVILGVGGECLMVALDKSTGREIWRTPNPDQWPLSHASVMPAEIAGVKQYLWCTLFGPVGVRASDGQLLWHHDRKFNVAVAPSPLPLPGDRVLMTSGYDAGTVLFRVKKDGDKFATEAIFDWTAEQWNSEVHTPTVYQDHIYAVGKKNRGLFTCFDLDGKLIWTSEGKADFDLGSFMLADGLFFILEGKTGMLRLVEASPTAYRELDHAQVLSGDNVWGPLALSDGKLVLRDMSKMVCLDVSSKSTASTAAGPSPDVAAGLRPGRSGPETTPIITSRASPDKNARNSLRLSAFRAVNATPLDTLVTRPFAVEAAQSLQFDDPPAHAPPPPLPAKYRKSRTLAGKGTAPGQFADELRGVAIDKNSRLYAVGDTKLVIFAPDGEIAQTWKTEKPGYCVTVANDGTTYVGEEGQIEAFDASGARQTVWRDAERLALVTSIVVTDDAVFVADVGDRCIRRYDRAGQFLANFEKNGRIRKFMLPNRYLDLAADTHGNLYVPHPGQHHVERYRLNGELQDYFGRFDGQDPAGFTGCCNPTNVALTPDGQIVVTEKAPPRTKVYNTRGELLALLGADDFDPNCKNMDVAVDPRGRIYVIDTVRLRVLVYEPLGPRTRQPMAESQP